MIFSGHIKYTTMTAHSNRTKSFVAFGAEYSHEKAHAHGTA